MFLNVFRISNKGTGFFVSGFATCIAFITAIIYQLGYHADQYYSPAVFYVLLSALPVFIVLTLLRLENFIPAVITAIIGIAALLFVYAMYFDISVVLVGIDKSSFDSRFIICCILFVISFIISEISIYMKTAK